jgi:hypothetical protein
MRVFLLKSEDFDDLKRRIELHYMKRAEAKRELWNSSFAHDDPRGKSQFDMFKETWFEVVRWTQEHGA